MIFDSFIFVLSIGSIVIIVRRNRDDFEAFNFADFMDKLVLEMRDVWHNYFHESFFLFLEKRLRNARVLFLKAETRLFHAANRVRGIKEKNGNGSNGNGSHPPDS